jgi:hypothetical protein
MATQMQMRNVMEAYLQALNHADVESILALFADGGTIPVGTGVHDARAGLTRLDD